MAGHDTGPISPADDTQVTHDAPGPPGPRHKSRCAESTPLQRALGLLARREHSRKELARKLVARGLDAGKVEVVIAGLAGDGWQDDARFAEALVRSRANAGYGPLRIRAELGAHGLDRDAIAAAMDGFDGDWIGNACKLVRRRFGAAFDRAPLDGAALDGTVLDDTAPVDMAPDDAAPDGDRNRQRKAADFLVRRGFAAGHIRAALRHAPDDED